MQPLRLACNAASARRMRHADGSALLQYAHDDVATPERVLHGQRGGVLIATTLAKGDVRSMHASRPVNNSTRDEFLSRRFRVFHRKGRSGLPRSPASPTDHGLVRVPTGVSPSRCRSLSFIVKHSSE